MSQAAGPTGRYTAMESDAVGRDRGFTLVELLIVIVVLGVLATVVVFSVSGATDDARAAACRQDEVALIRQVEAYYAQNGEYGSESAMVADGLLRTESELFEVNVATDQRSYTVSPVGSCAP